MGVLEGEEKEKVAESIFEEIMAKYFQNLMKYMNLHLKEGEQIPRRLNSKKFHTKTHNQAVK